MPREWDLTSGNALQAAAAWLLKKSGALCVVIVRVDDLAVAGDPQLAPRDVLTLLDDRAPHLHETLERERQEALAKLDRRNARRKP